MLSDLSSAKSEKASAVKNVQSLEVKIADLESSKKALQEKNASLSSELESLRQKSKAEVQVGFIQVCHWLEGGTALKVTCRN